MGATGVGVRGRENGGIPRWGFTARSSPVTGEAARWVVFLRDVSTLKSWRSGGFFLPPARNSHTPRHTKDFVLHLEGKGPDLGIYQNGLFWYKAGYLFKPI